MLKETINEIKNKRRIGSASERMQAQLNEICDALVMLEDNIEAERTQRIERQVDLTRLSTENAKAIEAAEKSQYNETERRKKIELFYTQLLTAITKYLDRPRLFNIWRFDGFKNWRKKGGYL